LNVSVSLSMTFAAVAHRAEGQFRRLKSTLNKLKSLKFRFGTRRPTDSIRVGQYFEPFKTFFKKGHLGNTSEHLRCVGNTSEHLRCVTASNLKHYHSCSLSDLKKNDDDKETETTMDALQTYKHPKKRYNSTQQRHIATGI